ncbi:MAG TPA: FAD-dependent monooxygenase, partial [Polyangiales bacterium]|nr:FAD-dependent monooxygenase [Polyangiales bacterium]
MSLTQDERGVAAQLTTAHGEQTIRSRYLVAADGGRSFVRHGLGVGFPGNAVGTRGRRGSHADWAEPRCLASLSGRRHGESARALPTRWHGAVSAAG